MATSITIASGAYEAIVRTNGGGLSSLTIDGRDLVEPFDPQESRTLYRGDLLAPWPNRIADAQYSFEGNSYTLSMNEVGRKNALHGLLLSLVWTVTEQSSDSVTLEVELAASDAYPTDLAFSVKYSLSVDGLAWKLEAKNVGLNRAPYGASIHPYLIADPASNVDQWNLRLPAIKFMQVDTERLLPVGIELVERADFNFNSSRVIGNQFIDHAFQINRENINQAVELIAPSGKGVSMKYDESARWIQIHTADRDGGANSREVLAVEPMTCPPDSFHSNLDLIILSPGDSTSSTWYIKGIN